MIYYLWRGAGANITATTTDAEGGRESAAPLVVEQSAERNNATDSVALWKLTTYAYD